MKLDTSHHQRGIVALLTVVFASILFSVVVVAMTTVISSEEHQASEADLSNRAYFAAESGVETGLLDIKKVLNGCTASQISNCPGFPAQNQCLTPSTVQGPSQAAYTCLVLSNQSNSPTFTLQKDGSYQVDLAPFTNITQIVINWHQPSIDGTNYGLINPFTTAANQLFAANGAWNNPAALEVQSILFNPADASNFDVTSQNDLKIIEDVLAPTAGGVGTTTEDDTGAGSTTNSGTPSGSTPLEASCVPSSGTAAQFAANNGYACSETIYIGNNPGGLLRILRIRARYTGTTVGIQVYNNGALATIPNSYENIDVTAKSGDTYRRVKAQVLVQQSTVNLDYALFSDTDICHDFEVRDSRSGNAAFGTLNSANQGSCPF